MAMRAAVLEWSIAYTLLHTHALVLPMFTNVSTLISYYVSHMPKHARLYHHLCDMWTKVMCKVQSVNEGESGDPVRLEWICIYMPN